MRKKRSGILRYLSAGVPSALLVILLSCVAFQETPPVGQSALPSKTVKEQLVISQAAIPFKVVDLKGRAVDLGDFRGRNLVLVFHSGQT